MVTIVGVITGDLPRQIRQSGISGMKKFAGNISESVFHFSPVEFLFKTLSSSFSDPSPQWESRSSRRKHFENVDDKSEMRREKERD